MVAYKSFQSQDIINNRIKTYPKVDFFIYDRKVYYNKKSKISGSFVNNIGHIDVGYLSLYEENIDRPTGKLIYPFLTKDSTLASFKSVSTSDFNSDFLYGDIISASYPFSSSISIDKIEVSGERKRIYALKTTFDNYQHISPHYSYNSSLGDKSTQKLSLISIPSIFYGNSIKKGSVDLNFYISGTLIGRLQDVKRNGELIQTEPYGSIGSGSIAGVCLYNEGFMVLTGAWNIVNSHTEVYDTGLSATYPKWYYFASTGSSGASENIPSSSFYMNFEGTNYINTLTMCCHAGKGEVNCSNNISWKKYGQVMEPSSGSYGFYERDKIEIKNIVKTPFLEETGSFEKTVYISNVKIYDENKRVICIAKLARPIRKKESNSLMFKVKLDLL